MLTLNLLVSCSAEMTLSSKNVDAASLNVMVNNFLHQNFCLMFFVNQPASYSVKMHSLQQLCMLLHKCVQGRHVTKTNPNLLYLKFSSFDFLQV